RGPARDPALHRPGQRDDGRAGIRRPEIHPAEPRKDPAAARLVTRDRDRGRRRHRRQVRAAGRGGGRARAGRGELGLRLEAVDGADEVDPALNLIKGRGGALSREKLVAAASKRFVVVVDDSKLVKQLGAGVLPVEVLPFLWRSTAERLTALGVSLVLRGGEEVPYVTDNGN